jgi:hypothetical protein
MGRLTFLRHGLPLLICLGAIVMVAIEPNTTGLEGAALLVSAGLSVWLLNWLWRVGVTGDKERDDEERARAYFDEHGHWPDEAPPGGAAPAPTPAAAPEPEPERTGPTREAHRRPLGDRRRR